MYSDSRTRHMKGVTPPLLTDSPNPNRRPSEHAVPSALRIGTPTIGDTPPFDVRPPLKRKSTSGTSDRLSQLFPSRPSSVASIVPPTSTPASRRQSFPPPIDTNSDTSYRIPRAPPPPSFAEETSYNPVASVFAQPRASPLLDKKNSRTKRVLHRIASLHGGASRGGSYYRLDDEEWGTRRAGLKGVEEDDEAVGYDLSLLSGLDLKGFEAQSVTEDRDKSRERIRDMNEASHAAEFENFESQLGAGMTSILHKPFTHTPSGPVPGFFPGHRRILSASDVANAEAKKAQVEAEKTGQVVAVATEIPVDISDFTAVTRDFDSMSSLSAGLVKKDAETSYFFPKGATSDVIPYALSNIDADPQMPAWRPTTMSWWWISMLIVIALALAGVQEYLCQISLRSVEKDPIKGGLSNFQRVGQLPITLYFAWQYAPIMIFVFYGVLWQMSDFEVKRLEPFYQLSKKTGATAGESLNMDYLTSLGTLIASSLVPVLQSASITMWPPEDNRENDGWKSIRRKSGLQSDSKGIAGIAAMATKSHILADFKGLDQAPLNKIHKQLRQRRYILHKSSLWQGEYISNSKEKIHEQDTDPRPLMLRLRVGVPFVGFLIAFTIIVPIVTFVEVAGAFTEELPWIMTDGKKFIPGLGGQDWDDNHDGKMNDPTDRYNTEQTFRSFWTSFTLTMLILLYLIGIALLTYKKRSQKFLPRQIGTMASVLAFIHQSKMLLSFIDTEKFTSSEMTRHLEKSGKTYALGWFRGRDGDDHLGIDEEEITSAYVYGKDWTSGRLRPGRESMWEHY
ncbi:conserved hypothetical protein [Pyrenophora tritici-repentis Pt-1C-BFP]|uniref:DUF3433 domain containing protein n=1 Tax=Pyrenophora tritici-repentis (strain Pt-1C-BFP) TaxID=426418 RepID=B2WDY8_PYRTR|nr:uncharacterized protein PTRG_08361 [Pyrenophora tritici-repentis Pt-1C-BFP]EDU51280.1 conserved hypothetical protein [Pyrenophora tritici-repentis Pt-1C-BFP]